MNHYFYHFLRAFHLQLALTLLALPIFIYWGLPLSVATYIATTLFSPFLTLFLLFSTLIFFGQLLHIPSNFLFYPLQLISDLWFYLLSFAHSGWLIGFAKPPTYVLCLMSLLTLFVLTYKKLEPIKTNTIALICLSTLFFSGLKLYPYLRSIHSDKIECGSKSLTIITYKQNAIIIDQSSISRKVSTQSWIQYTLCAALLQKTGKLTIDCFVARTISNRLLEALAQIAKTCTLKQVYIPYNPTITHANNQKFTECMQTLEKHATKCMCVEKPISIMLNNCIEVQIKKGTQPYLQTTIAINNNHIDF